MGYATQPYLGQTVPHHLCGLRPPLHHHPGYWWWDCLESQRGGTTEKHLVRHSPYDGRDHHSTCVHVRVCYTLPLGHLAGTSGATGFENQLLAHGYHILGGVHHHQELLSSCRVVTGVERILDHS